MSSRRRVRLRRHKPRPPVDGTMTLVEHLGELRSRLVKSLLAFVALTAAAAIFIAPIQRFLTAPFCEATRDLPASQVGLPQAPAPAPDQGAQTGETQQGQPQQGQPQQGQPQGCRALIFLKVYGAFAFQLKLIAIVGLGLSAPVWLYQIYAFVLPALKPNEKRYSFMFVVSAAVLFLIGSSFAYFTLSKALNVLLGFGGGTLSAAIVADEYLKFVGLMILGFGASFELPLLLVFLSLAEIIDAPMLRKNRRIAVIVIFALAAVVTPSTDPLTMTLLAVPLYVLYEATIYVVAFIGRRREQREQAAQPA